MPVDNRHIWAAGFLDGEGSFQTSINDKRMRVEISAAQTDIRPLDILEELYGGSIYWNNGPKSGKQEYGVWSIHSVESIEYAVPFWIPYLTVKREQAEALLKICKTKCVAGKRGSIDALRERPLREKLIRNLIDLKREPYVPC